MSKKKLSKNIDCMTPIEICEYLNSGNHHLPIIMKTTEGYSFFDKCEYGHKIIKNNLTLDDAFKEMKNIGGCFDGTR